MVVTELLRVERTRPMHELDTRLCEGTGTWMGCARLEQRWLSAARDAGSMFDASLRNTIVGVSLAFTTP